MRLTPNFKLSEFDCTDGTPVPDEYVDNVKALAKELQVVRDIIGLPLEVNSGFRTREYNDSLPNSSPNSYHLTGRAADIATPQGWTSQRLFELFEECIAKRLIRDGGLSCYSWGVHYDTGRKGRRW